MSKVTVVGAGLAGCEAAWQLAQRGFSVDLLEMKRRKCPRPTKARILRSWSAPIPFGGTGWKTPWAC